MDQNQHKPKEQKRSQVRPQFSLKQAAAKKYGPMEGCTHGYSLRGTEHEKQVKEAVNHMAQAPAKDTTRTSLNQVVFDFWSKEQSRHLATAVTFQCLLDLVVREIFEYQDDITAIRVLLLNLLIVRAMVRGFGLPPSGSSSERNEAPIGKAFGEAKKKCRTARGLLLLVESLLPCSCMTGIVHESHKSTKTDLCMGYMKECSVKDLKNCARCKLVCYCSKECRLRDYPNHKGFCKTVAKK